jgi:hypothetical protein
MSSVAATPKTAVVRVDQVLEAPEALDDFTGREVTVGLGSGERLKEGQQAIFYTLGLSLGEGLAVRSLGHRDARRAAGLQSAVAAGGDPVDSLAQRDQRTHVESADVVVTGRVTDVRLPAEAEATRALAAGAAGEPGAARPISEHDPKWREAVVQVDAVEKGAPPRELVVRFPESTDVRWYRAPKFRPGDQGVFVLHKTPAAEAAAGPPAERPAAAREGGPEVYTALDALDFQPLEQLGQIREHVRATGGSKDG